MLFTYQTSPTCDYHLQYCPLALQRLWRHLAAFRRGGVSRTHASARHGIAADTTMRAVAASSEDNRKLSSLVASVWPVTEQCVPLFDLPLCSTATFNISTISRDLNDYSSPAH